MFLENGFSMNDRDKVIEIIKSLKDSSNNDLKFALRVLSKDFDEIKSQIITLTKHLDNVEKLYNKVLSEYDKRNPTK